MAYETITIETGAEVDGQLRRIAAAAERDGEPPLLVEPAPRLIETEAQAA